MMSQFSLQLPGQMTTFLCSTKNTLKLDLCIVNAYSVCMLIKRSQNEAEYHICNQGLYITVLDLTQS